MEPVHSLLVFLHILGTAAIVGGWLAFFKTPTVTLWQWIGALVQLVTGLLLVGMIYMNDGQPNNAKIGVKTVILLVVLVAAFIGRRKVKNGEEVPKGLAHAVGGMAFINVAVAVFWS